VIGGGRVGRAASRVLADAGINHRIVERRPDRVRDPARYVQGDAAEIEVLREAGFADARAVLVTSHEDDVNVYLTIYCRKLRADVQVIARANLERSVSTLHRAGADAVLSYASLGAASIWNALGPHDALVLAEGLEVFRTPVPHRLAGRPLRTAGIREATRCHVVAIARGARMDVNPDADTVLPADADLVLVGDAAAEHAYLTTYGRGKDVSRAGS
jgi:Trk K+ transport system NAD-binding subunit